MHRHVCPYRCTSQLVYIVSKVSYLVKSGGIEHRSSNHLDPLIFLGVGNPIHVTLCIFGEAQLQNFVWKLCESSTMASIVPDCDATPGV